MPRVKWLREASADVERLYEFLRTKNPKSAAKVMEIILSGSELLESSPRLGRPMDDNSGRRELSLPFSAGCYVLRYMHDAEGVVHIIRVWHSREDRS